jgi:uncharacterized damage-inducible protein DinB
MEVPPSDGRPHLLDAVLESWDRSSEILQGLLRALPEGGLDARATPDGPTVAEQLAHIHHERLISVSEEAPEFAREVPRDEWAPGRDRDLLARQLAESAVVVRDAVRGRILAGRGLDRHYDHPVLMLQLLLWHEAYHHGQIKLALKVAGRPIDDDTAGPFTWDVWRLKRRG